MEDEESCDCCSYICDCKPYSKLGGKKICIFSGYCYRIKNPITMRKKHSKE